MSDDELPCEQDIFERDLILDELNRIIQLATTNEQHFRSRTIDLAVHQRKFNKVQTKIEKTLIKIKSFNKEEQIKVRNDFNDLYYTIVTYLNNLKKEDEQQRRTSRSFQASEVIVQANRKNLPILPLPEFNGDPTDWPSFYDLFRSLVHNNSAYCNAEKFRYLLLAVKNEPHNLIKSIPITDENYLVALDILVSRYDNKRIIASKHLDKILDIEPCSDRLSHSVRNLLNIYQENIKALEVMNFPITQWSFILLNILLRKIPLTIRRTFERSLSKPSEIPDVCALISFLEREISADEITISTVSNVHSAKKPSANVGNSVKFSGRSNNASGGTVPTARRSLITNLNVPIEQSRSKSNGNKTHTRDETGRYVVALPFKPNAPRLGESRQIALARFRKLEYRLERNVQLKTDYHTCLQEYEDLNHMELVDSEPLQGASYYIPHHCVVKESSKTTRTRVVFDAGCRTTSGLSLNDVLLTGPKLHLDIVDVLLKFRVHAVAFSADIKQMYRNILIRETDRDFQRILWRKSPEEPIRDYRLHTVTFGVNSSPYLALRTIQQLAHDEAEYFRLASPVLLSDVFVDDVVSGEDTESKTLALQQELIDICKTAGFELRKWHSNSSAILATLQPPACHGERPENVPFSEMENDKRVKVLGLQWNPGSDTFNFKVQVTTHKCTKRSILSEIAKIYDPLGLLSPVTLYAKHLIQLLWMANVDWDDNPPIDIINSWTRFINELPLLSQVSFPRYIFSNNIDSVEIHGFADASQIAYAGCVYIRLTSKDGNIYTYLIMAKTRVAPLRAPLTIPRLELMAALLLSKLLDKIANLYRDRICPERIYAWSDATIVLAWLRSSPHEWKTFVSNRTSDILSRVPASCWHHVPSADNPADAASRGLLPTAMVQHDLWYHGPAWLRRSADNWPVETQTMSTCEEKRNLTLSSAMSTAPPVQNTEIIMRFSSLGKLVRITALIFRFYNKCKRVKNSFPGYITVPEYNFSLNRLIYLTQQSVFQDDILKISQGRLPSNQLRRLTPFLDSDKLLRVGGRIHKSLLPFESKHQIILPKKHALTNLIIDDAHMSYLHAGPQSVQYLLLQRYWILSCRDIVRQRIHRCVRCFRARPTRDQPIMGPLPASRIRPARPFLKTAVDYAGPFFVRANKVRNAKIVKCYVSVFVCMSVKAVHLELVSELSTDAFLAALRRFTARRGLCTDTYSDCGKNFVGCNNYLKDLYAFLRSHVVQSTINQQTLQQGLTWHFQPPYASHFGGLFEASVKSFKHHLHRVVGTRTQTYDEMHTLLCQIEAVLNSRPLCAMSSASTDPLPLTPSHFLIGEPLTALPDVSLLDENPNRLTRWRWIQQSVQHFWKRWSREYLHHLQQSSKWLHDRGSAIREGTVVVVCDEHLPPLQWKLARVHAVHLGSDQVTRVVTLKAGNTIFKRPVVKICPLPLE
ncbi:unnamed protein product [Parnassius mnemosyne]|uniref:Integrase catalytic domain-containing protein n=1 Tax=Parnassius mnemosyne TaxID=213953 RepID=A0AAV1L2W8_9NEOP